MKIIVKSTETIPGIASLYAIPKHYLLNTTGPNLQFQNPVNQIIYRFDFALDSCNGAIRTVQTDAGIYYDVKFQAFIPGINKDNLSLLKELQIMGQLLVIFQTYDGHYFRIGNISNGLKVFYTETTSPRIGYEVNFLGNVLEPQTRSIFDPDNPSTIYV